MLDTFFDTMGSSARRNSPGALEDLSSDGLHRRVALEGLPLVSTLNRNLPAGICRTRKPCAGSPALARSIGLSYRPRAQTDLRFVAPRARKDDDAGKIAARSALGRRRPYHDGYLPHCSGGAAQDLRPHHDPIEVVSTRQPSGGPWRNCRTGSRSVDTPGKSNVEPGYIESFGTSSCPEPRGNQSVA
jgi:hypothetical protein